MNKFIIKSAIFVLLSIFTSLVLNAQTYSFRVLGTKGANTAGGNALRVGSTIAPNQTITVGTDAYLGLAHSSGKTLELKKAGTYTVKELEAKLNTHQSDLASQYAKFIVDELTASGDAAGRQARMSKTGSVQRASAAMAPIQVMLPTATDVLDGKITLKWYLSDNAKIHANDVKKYKVSVTNMFGEMLVEKEVTEKEITLDLLSDELKKESKAIMYSVSVVGHPEVNSGDEPYSLKKLKPTEMQSIKHELASLPTDDSALNKIILARFFEDKGLIANAMYAYEEAVKSSELDQYQSLYNSFLERNNLSKEARTSLKN
jgi:hypothetical protein